MKNKLILTFLLFISIVGTSSAPPSNTITIIEPTPIFYIDAGFYTPLVYAIGKYESNNCDTIVNRNKVPGTNELELATGRLQIRPCRVEHFNNLTGKNYTIEDMCDFNKAKEVFLYFTNHDGSGHKIPRKSWEQAAKNWNGSGPKTEDYWREVSKIL